MRIIALTLLLFGIRAYADSEPVEFNRDIRPILSDKCYACHGPDKEAREADLRLDTEEGSQVDLDGHQAIVPGNPDKSSLILRINSDDEDLVMPPPSSHLSLNNNEKELLRQWIKEGAKWQGHWSFQPISGPSLTSHNGHPIDAMVHAHLKKNAVEPAAPATPVVWLRRVTQDLTGLPPTLAQIDAFLADSSDKAYEKVVDRLLSSVDYAERMTTIWLDNARYADSNGFQFDNARTMWPWRDWVIKSFRENMAYDQFVTQQLAGDLLENPSQDQLIATGFNRNHGYSIEGGINDEEYRVMYANDKTTTFGTLFLGLTMECTRCHDHKYDPLTMEDYYSLSAFFNTSAEVGAPGESGRKKKVAAPFIEYFPTAGQSLSDSDKTSKASDKPVLVMVMEEKKRDSHILLEGLFDQIGAKVEPRTPTVLPGFDGYPANRLGLAQWLCADDNPLFARVTVNRLWQQLFGVGIVKSSDNLGLQGELPSHPALLDWLATEFRENDWDLQHVIRMIVLSDTYRQSSKFRKEIEDPDNRLLARGPSFRLPAELIRDQALAASGLISQAVGGPSVMPYQPAKLWDDLNAPPSHAETYTQSSGDNLYRKSLYTYWRRAVPHPEMATFDAPSRDVCSVERIATNTPLQALVTLHAPIYLESSRVLAESLIGKKDPIQLAFRCILSRQADAIELSALSQLHQDRLESYQKDPEAARRFLKVGEHPTQPNSNKAEVAALADVCLAIFNLSESLTRK
jgi:hypothetical protein